MALSKLPLLRLALAGVLVASTGLSVGGCSSIAIGPFAKPAASPGWLKSSGEQGPMMTLPARSMNLSPGSRYHYAKIRVTLELGVRDAGFFALKGTAREEAEKRLVADREYEVPILLDAVAMVVSHQPGDDLVTPAGRSQLKADLLGAFQERVGKESVTAVYLDTFAVE